MAEGYEPKFLTPEEITTKGNILSGINPTASYHVHIPTTHCGLLIVCQAAGNASTGIVYRYADQYYLVGMIANYATISGNDIVITGSYSLYKFFY